MFLNILQLLILKAHFDIISTNVYYTHTQGFSFINPHLQYINPYTAGG